MQGAAIGHLLDLRRPERGDPVLPGRFEVLAIRALVHAAITDHHHTIQGKASLQLADLLLSVIGSAELTSHTPDPHPTPPPRCPPHRTPLWAPDAEGQWYRHASPIPRHRPPESRRGSA